MKCLSFGTSLNLRFKISELVPDMPYADQLWYSGTNNISPIVLATSDIDTVGNIGADTIGSM